MCWDEDLELLLQEGIPLSFESKEFKGTDFVKSTYEKEMKIILHVIRNEDNMLSGGILKSKWTYTL